jgi:hypothetical protein
MFPVCKIEAQRRASMHCASQSLSTAIKTHRKPWSKLLQGAFRNSRGNFGKENHPFPVPVLT